MNECCGRAEQQVLVIKAAGLKESCYYVFRRPKGLGWFLQETFQSQPPETPADRPKSQVQASSTTWGRVYSLPNGLHFLPLQPIRSQGLSPASKALVEAPFAIHSSHLSIPPFVRSPQSSNLL